jgi:deoxycytidine triphosphate deaminase
MTVLSDSTIRRLMAANQLVLNGDAAFAKHCSYEFKAGRVVYGGLEPPALQVTAIDLWSTPAQTATIQPSGVAWVRSRERVKIPSNIVGVWVQTNTLSRRGLLLLNSTLVEPGYEGNLSAHFVNLGSSPVSLSSATTIAKLVFVKLDTDATELIDSKPFGNYDAMIDDLAACSNRSFLRISELVPDLSKASDTSVAEAKKQIGDFIEESIKDTKNDMAELKKETFYKVGGGFAVGLIVVAAVLFFLYPILRSIDVDSTDRITKVVAAKNTELTDQLKKLQTDIDAIKQGMQRGTAPTPR